MDKKKCDTCDDEGVCWVLEACPDCEKGYQVSHINQKFSRRRLGKLPKMSTFFKLPKMSINEKKEGDV